MPVVRDHRGHEIASRDRREQPPPNVTTVRTEVRHHPYSTRNDGSTVTTVTTTTTTTVTQVDTHRQSHQSTPAARIDRPREKKYHKPRGRARASDPAVLAPRKCFNCDGNHWLKDCTIEPNWQRINAARADHHGQQEQTRMPATLQRQPSRQPVPVILGYLVPAVSMTPSPMVSSQPVTTNQLAPNVSLTSSTGQPSPNLSQRPRDSHQNFAEASPRPPRTDSPGHPDILDYSNTV